MQGRRRGARIAAVLAVVAWILALAPPALGQGPQRVVRYRGYQVAVPSSWPVYDLSRAPRACVRFDRHALYLGTPGTSQRCPAHALGRTEAILLEPMTAGKRAPAPAAGNLAEVPVPAHHLEVTASWRSHPGVVARALGIRTARALEARATARAAAAAPAPAHAAARGGIYTGLGFDVCSTPSSRAMAAWGASPYRAIGVYIGGANMACSQPNLTPGWVSQETTAGWHLILIYVGLQAPGNSCGCASISASRAGSQGAAAAADAIARAQALGVGPGNPIYDDMEAYSHTSAHTSAVLAFLTGWTRTLHAHGYLSGAYSSTGSGIADLVSRYGTGYPEPDEIWVADWNGSRTTNDPSLPSGYWPNHQRVHQYDGGHNETWGGVTLNIDHDYLDAATAAGSPCFGQFAEGSFVQVTGSSAVYRIAGAAAMLVSSGAAFGGQQPVIVISAQQFQALCPVPAAGTFLTTSTGAAYRIAGGAPIRISDWSRFGGVQPTVQIDQWDIDNLGNPAVHMFKAPANGTVVEGLPSRRYWSFNGGRRRAVGRTSSAVRVDDAGLAAFPAIPCISPRLRNLTLAQARSAIAKSGCRLGKIRRSGHWPRGHRLRVVWQMPHAGKRHPAGWLVGIRLR